MYQKLPTSESEGPGCCSRCCGFCCGPRGRLVWLGTSVLLIIVLCICAYQNRQWEVAREDELASQTSIANTSLGDVEYYKKGSAPYVFFIHGQMGGWDICTVPLVVDPWINAGYGIICPSRPGYLRSPLTRYPVSTDEQADLMAALLDFLHVDKVVVTGGSAGGPTIYQFGIKYSHRIVALIPLVAISEAKPELPGTPMCCIDRDGNFPLYPAKLTTFFMTDATVGRLLYWTMQDVAASLTSGMVQMSSLSQEQQEAEIKRVESNQTLKDTATMILLTTATPFAPRWPGNENDIYANTFVELELGNITSPTLIVHDEFAGSNGVPLEYAHHAKRNIPNAELYIVPGAWHIIWLAEHWSDAMAKQIEFAKAAAANGSADASNQSNVM